MIKEAIKVITKETTLIYMATGPLKLKIFIKSFAF